MLPNHSPTILLIGNDAPLGYLLKRYAERGGYPFRDDAENLSSLEIASSEPCVLIFLSMELLAGHQALVKELADREAAILVCSSVVEEVRAREMGADYCLLHPLTYDDFQAALSNVAASKHA